MTQTIQFSKYHGLGNDFILINAISQRIDIDKIRTLTPELCDRHMGIGADGVILALSSEQSDIQMRIFNADGSEPEMCGNGLRCFAKWVHDKSILSADMVSVETLAGVKLPALTNDSKQISTIEVDMGEPQLGSTVSLTSHGYTFEATEVSMGNPHAVIFVESLADIDLAIHGPTLAQHDMFPNGCNIEFVEIMSRNEARLNVWERGAGETLACGTGACATLVAAVKNNTLDRNACIHLPGGDLLIEWQESNNRVIMTGPAAHVYDGNFQL